MSQQPSQHGRASWFAFALGLVSAAYLAWLLVISIAQAEDAEAAGYVVGTLVAASLAALSSAFSSSGYGRRTRAFVLVTMDRPRPASVR